MLLGSGSGSACSADRRGAAMKDEASARVALVAAWRLAGEGGAACPGPAAPVAAGPAAGTAACSRRRPCEPREPRKLRELPGRPTRDVGAVRQRWESLLRDSSSECGEVEAQLAACGGSLRRAALAVLQEGRPRVKAALSLSAARAFLELGTLSAADEGGLEAPPATPARDCVRTVAPKDVARRGGAGSQENRVRMVHALAHIESVAIDLSWDMVARFGFPASSPDGLAWPEQFLRDWVEVALEESIHHLLWEQRLLELGSWYGALPTHSGLWDSAWATRDSALERLVVEHCVLEARGLDVCPQSFRKFLDAGDETSAGILEAIYAEEISHVEKGLRWLAFQVERQQLAGLEARSAVQVFHDIVDAKLRGTIKPPFNDTARALAGMDRAFYVRQLAQPS